jgi:hypothetical protein
MGLYAFVTFQGQYNDNILGAQMSITKTLCIFKLAHHLTVFVPSFFELNLIKKLAEFRLRQ